MLQFPVPVICDLVLTAEFIHRGHMELVKQCSTVLIHTVQQYAMFVDGSASVFSSAHAFLCVCLSVLLA